MARGEGFVQVAADGSGKKIRNITITYELPDGTLQTVYQQEVVQVDELGLRVEFATPEQFDKLLNGVAALRHELVELRDRVLPVTPSGDTIQPSLLAPFPALGHFSIVSRTPTYGALGAGTPLHQFRNPSDRIVVIVMRANLLVRQTAAAGAIGLIDRELIMARGWTVPDTGGSTVTIGASDNKRWGATMHRSVVDLRTGGGLTAGTRNLDGNPLAQAVGVTPNAGNNAGAVQNVLGLAIPATDLIDYRIGQHPVVLGQNDGLLVRVGSVAAIATEQTDVAWDWLECTPDDLDKWLRSGGRLNDLRRYFMTPVRQIAIGQDLVDADGEHEPG